MVAGSSPVRHPLGRPSAAFPAYFASGIGLAFVFIPLSLAALAGVNGRIAGVASGLLNTSQQIGGALGVAIISTISTTDSENLLADSVQRVEALTEGFQWPSGSVPRSRSLARRSVAWS